VSGLERNRVRSRELARGHLRRLAGAWREQLISLATQVAAMEPERARVVSYEKMIAWASGLPLFHFCGGDAFDECARDRKSPVRLRPAYSGTRPRDAAVR